MKRFVVFVMQLHKLPKNLIIVVSYGKHYWYPTEFIVSVDGGTCSNQPSDDVKISLAASEMHYSLLVFCLDVCTCVRVVQ